jgi:hypothetical protein
MDKVGTDTFLVTVSTKSFAVACSSLALTFELGIFPGYSETVCWALESWYDAIRIKVNIRKFL